MRSALPDIDSSSQIVRGPAFKTSQCVPVQYQCALLLRPLILFGDISFSSKGRWTWEFPCRVFSGTDWDLSVLKIILSLPCPGVGHIYLLNYRQLYFSVWTQIRVERSFVHAIKFYQSSFLIWQLSYSKFKTNI